MSRYMLTFTVKPGSESTVANLLRNYQRPPAAAAPTGPPLLRRTSVFMAGRRVVRVIDVAGGIGAVMRHLAGLPQIRELEAALDPHLTLRRDLGTPEGLRAFLYSALVPAVSGAAHPPWPEGPLRSESDSAGSGTVRCALRYPARPGCGRRLARLLAGSRAAGNAGPVAAALGGIGSTSVFGREDLVVELIESDLPAPEVLDRIAKDLPAGTVARLAELMAGDPADPPGADRRRPDLASTGGLREFLAGCQMELLTDRRVGVPA
jgi:hypothetical protein